MERPFGKLAPGMAEVGDTFKDMWKELDKNPDKFGCTFALPSFQFHLASKNNVMARKRDGLARPCCVNAQMRPMNPTLLRPEFLSSPLTRTNSSRQNGDTARYLGHKRPHGYLVELLENDAGPTGFCYFASAQSGHEGVYGRQVSICGDYA
jgi:hypothetical protein